jgi:hypothetical protein
MSNASPVRADSPFLLDILEGIRRRRKALRSHNANPIVERIIEVRDGNPVERIEIVFHPRTNQTLTVIVWENRSIWVHACEAIKNAGWKFQYTASGRFLAPGGGRDLVPALEASLSRMFEMTRENSVRLSEIWDRLLANGPQPT